MFFSIDENNDGYITLKELQEAMKGKLTPEQLEQILRAVDTDKNGAINYTEFVAATLRSDVYQDNKHLMNAFEFLDQDGNGFIEEKELAKVIGLSLGQSQDTVKKLISEIDDSGDGKIDFHEFKKMLTVLTTQK